MVGQLLTYCVTNRTVTGLIATGVTDIILLIALWTWGQLSL